MASTPGLVILRRFLPLQARNLLLLEAQILEKERQLLQAIRRDRESSDAERNSFATDFRAMMESKLVFEESEPGQKDIFLEIRPLLREHGEGLLLFKQLFNLPPVDSSDLQSLRKVCRGRGRTTFLKATEATTWNEENKADLTSLLSCREEMDTVSNWLGWFRVEVFHKYWGYKSSRPAKIPADWRPEYPVPIRTYSEKSSSSFVLILRTILGPILPMASVLCLFFVKDPVVQMGVVVLSSFIFSTVLAFVTVKTDTFVATATFTAVIVVFVGSNARSCLCEC